MTRDLRRYARQTNFRLFVGFFLILYLVGDGLIFYLYGSGPALFGLMCLVAGTFPLILIALILWGMEKVVEREYEK
jgi:hypothetical protein